MTANAETIAPSGQKKLARGKKRSAAAPGHEFQNAASPERAKESGIGRYQVALDRVARHHSGNSKLIKGKLHDAPADNLFPAFSATGQDVWRDAYDREGDAIIISAVGARCGKCFLARGRWSAIANTHVVWPDPEKADIKFLWYLLNDEQFWIRSGSAQPFVAVRKTFEKEIFVPPLREQQQIVAEIEKQFTRLEAGATGLRRVQANLKRYRAAVLKAACEGRLVRTEAELAKAENRKFETGAELLARILTQRRQQWQDRGKYKEPITLSTTKLYQLPAGWTWTTLDALTEIKGGITKDQNRKHTAPARAVPYLRVANVQRGYLDLTEVKEIVTTEDEIRELALKAGDILFNEGGDRDKLGRGWVWNGELPECIHQNHVFRARLFVPEVNPKLISWYANTFGQQFFFDEGKHTTNLASISMTKLKQLPVPVPPPAEQIRIVAEVERRLSVVEELEAVVTANVQRAIRLRQSCLQLAFSGQLHL
ncbi:MAG TPA: restriction endonuclease subunit S [Chthoniobacterales bacterium]|jgi:type I restriction enzyme S subunit